MLLLEAQHLPCFTIAQGRFIPSHLPSDLRIRTRLLQILHGRRFQRTGRVRRVENLESRRTFLNAEVANLTKISRIDITPCVPLPRFRLVNVSGEIRLIFVRLDDIPDSQGVDIRTGESSREASCTALSTQFAERIGIHGIAVVVLFQWKLVVICVPLRKTDTVRGLTARNDDFLDAQLTCRFNHVVCAQYVTLEAFVIWNQHIPRIRCEVDHRIRGWDGLFRIEARVFVVRDIEVGAQRVEYLTGVCQVGLECVHAIVW